MNSGFFGRQTRSYDHSEDNKERNSLRSLLAFGIIIVGMFIIFGTGYLMQEKEDYRNLYTIKYYTDGGSEIDPSVALDGETIELPIPEKDDYDFTGWVDNEGKSIDSPYKVTKDITLIATYKISDILVVHVTFDFDNNKTPIKEEKIKQGEYVTEPTEEPIRIGYFFKGWYLDGKKFDFDTPLYEDTYLKVKWEPDLKHKFAVTFSNAGTNEKVRVLHSKTVKKPKDPERDKYIFKGWYLNGELFDFNTPITDNITLAANWEAKTENNKSYVLLMFDVNGGDNLVAPKLCVKDESCIKPTDPTREGYAFVGWYLNGKLFDFGTKIKEDMTLVARWKVDKTKEENEYQINN